MGVSVEPGAGIVRSACPVGKDVLKERQTGKYQEVRSQLVFHEFYPPCKPTCGLPKARLAAPPADMLISILELHNARI